MQNSLNTIIDDEIDLFELFMTLWAYKFLIISICILSIIFGAQYALNSDKEFTTKAIFRLNVSQSSNALPFGSELSLVGRMSGLLSTSFSTTIPKEEIKGRVFIEKFDSIMNLQADPYFNNYDPELVDPVWKSTIKRIIGWKKPTPNIEELIWQGIISKFKKSINIEPTDDGNIKVEVTHENAVRAADIANAIVEEIISTAKNTQESQQDKQLFYLSNTLAKSQSDLELAQSNLKVFALENSALPLETFAAGSLQLEALREQLSRTTELHKAVAELSMMLKNKTTTQDNYSSLRQRFPIVDQVEFRRVLGQNEIISSWSWPEASSVSAVFDTLSERKSRLQSQIDASQIGAERSSRALDEYARLVREEKVANATYTVLIEQVKAQSMLAGFRPNKSKIYEYASPPISPSAPQRNLILVVSTILGFLLGCIISLILGTSRSVYFSRKSLIKGAQSSIKINIKTLISLRNRNLHEINKRIKKKHLLTLRDFAVEIHKSRTTQTVITSSRARMTANEVGRALALTMHSEDTKIAVIDFSTKSKKLSDDIDPKVFGSFILKTSEGHVSVLRPRGDMATMELISKKGFLKEIQSLDSHFSLTFLCADNDDAISLLRAIEGQKMYHLTLARTKHTKSFNLTSMRTLLPIQGLIYD